jgi:hypothetical protein
MNATLARPWPGDLDWGSDWVRDASGDLAHFGFLLRDAERPGIVPGPRLLVAMRSAPTLEHFDPESVSCWVHDGERGNRMLVTRDTRKPLRRPFSWGQVQVADRIPVANRFLTFGGELMVEADDDEVTWVALVSPVPIVRWAGHSQAMDRLAVDIGAFFGRLKVPVDYQPEAERRVGIAGPEALYVTFLERSAAHLGPPDGPLRRLNPSFTRYVDRERRRMREHAPAAWTAGCNLHRWLELS